MQPIPQLLGLEFCKIVSKYVPHRYNKICKVYDQCHDFNETWEIVNTKDLKKPEKVSKSKKAEKELD